MVRFGLWHILVWIEKNLPVLFWIKFRKNLFPTLDIFFGFNFIKNFLRNIFFQLSLVRFNLRNQICVFEKKFFSNAKKVNRRSHLNFRDTQLIIKMFIVRLREYYPWLHFGKRFTRLSEKKRDKIDLLYCRVAVQKNDLCDLKCLFWFRRYLYLVFEFSQKKNEFYSLIMIHNRITMIDTYWTRLLKRVCVILCTSPLRWTGVLLACFRI